MLPTLGTSSVSLTTLRIIRYRAAPTATSTPCR